MYGRILLAYDGATFSQAVLRQGVALAKLCQAEVHLVGIVATGGAIAIADSVGAGQSVAYEDRELQDAVAAAVQDIRRQGIEVTAVIRVGEPASQIVAYAREIDADLIVLGHSGKGLVSRWVEGSVGEALLKHLPCSLLIAA